MYSISACSLPLSIRCIWRTAPFTRQLYHDVLCSASSLHHSSSPARAVTRRARCHQTVEESVSGRIDGMHDAQVLANIGTYDHENEVALLTFGTFNSDNLEIIDSHDLTPVIARDSCRLAASSILQREKLQGLTQSANVEYLIRRNISDWPLPPAGLAWLCYISIHTK